jgi:hypothetical protein
VYHYRVVNKEPGSAIYVVRVGYDHSHGIPMLKKDPPGHPEDAPGGGQSRICAPGGWRGKIVYTEETLEFQIQWDANRPKHRIQSGQALSGFAIEVPTAGADDSYRNSFFDVIFFGGRYLHTSTHITADTPPAPGVLLPLNNCVDPYAQKTKSDNDDESDDDESKDKDD